MRKAMLFFLFALVIPLRAAPPIGAVVMSWDIDSAKNAVTLHMVNNTAKDITFYNVSIKEIYGLNVNDHQFSQELPNVSVLINDPTNPTAEFLRRYHHGENGTWKAGTTRDVRLTIQSGLTSFNATIDAVLYDDNTAEAPNADALNRERDNKKSAAETLRQTNEVIRRAVSNTADPSPSETAATEIEGLEKAWEAGGHRGIFNRGASGRIISDLKEAPATAARMKQSLPDYLANMTTRNEKLASQYLEQANAKVGGVK